MAHYPVMFTFQDVVSGNGFLSGVTMAGRALMCKESDGKWWVYGVHPGGMAHFGESAMEAFSNFRTSYRTVLFDIAEEASNFDAFKTEVDRFYNEVGECEEARWEEALEALRSGKVIPEEPFSKLPRHKPESRPCKVQVERLDQIASNRFSSKDNVSDTFELPLAA
ncbi:MAG: hypothetical protein ABSG77_08065 [Candidatus Acidiferrum sp.]